MVESFLEKLDGDENSINVGYFVYELEVFDYMADNDDTVVFEGKSLE